MKLSVIIPAYNELHRIGKTLEAMDGWLTKQGFDYEILVVDDGSNDGSEQVTRALEKKIRNLRLIDNRQNHGKGWVVKQGMLEAKGDWRLFMDADNSTSVDQVANFFPFTEQGFDIIVGSRRIEGADIKVHQNLFRDFLGGVFRTIVHILAPVGVTDTQCGFKLFSARAAQAIFLKQTIFRWAFDVEILSIARKMKFKIKEAPIVWVNEGESKVKFGGMVKMLFEVIQVRLNLWGGKYK